VEKVKKLKVGENLMLSFVFFSSLIVLFLASQVLTQTYFPGKCPKVKVVNHFNLQRYLGTWYEVRTYSVPWRANGRCTTAEYGLYPNGTVSILNTVELYGQPGQLLTSALVIGPGILAISGPSNPRSRFPHLKDSMCFNKSHLNR
jgi:hypothetical protein